MTCPRPPPTSGASEAGTQRWRRAPLYTTERLSQVLRDLAAELGRPPTVWDLRIHHPGLSSPSAYYKHFGSWVAFELDGEVLERRLVTRPAEDESTELNAQSPVGRALLSATVGESTEVETPGGALMVKVLSINGREGGDAGD